MKKAESAFQRLADRIVNMPKPEVVNNEDPNSYDIQEILARNSKEFKDSRAKQGR